MEDCWHDNDVLSLSFLFQICSSRAELVSRRSLGSVALNESDTVTWCMVEWCTQNLRRNGSISRGTSHATTTERYQYTTSVDIKNTRYKRIQSLIQNHIMPMCAVSLLERGEERYIKKKRKKEAMNDNSISSCLSSCQPHRVTSGRSNKCTLISKFFS